LAEKEKQKSNNRKEHKGLRTKFAKKLVENYT